MPTPSSPVSSRLAVWSAQGGRPSSLTSEFPLRAHRLPQHTLAQLRAWILHQASDLPGHADLRAVRQLSRAFCAACACFARVLSPFAVTVWLRPRRLRRRHVCASDGHSPAQVPSCHPRYFDLSFPAYSAAQLVPLSHDFGPLPWWQRARARPVQADGVAALS
eukprot:scaffold141_cov410-Prasinococcus_capsulatus_cf.AAC.3